MMNVQKTQHALSKEQIFDQMNYKHVFLLILWHLLFVLKALNYFILK